MEEVGEAARHYISLIPVIGNVYIICCRLTEMDLTKTKLAFVILALVGFVIIIGLGLGTSGENDIDVKLNFDMQYSKYMFTRRDSICIMFVASLYMTVHVYHVQFF